MRPKFRNVYRSEAERPQANKLLHVLRSYYDRHINDDAKSWLDLSKQDDLSGWKTDEIERPLYFIELDSDSWRVNQDNPLRLRFRPNTMNDLWGFMDKKLVSVAVALGYE